MTKHTVFNIINAFLTLNCMHKQRVALVYSFLVKMQINLNLNTYQHLQSITKILLIRRAMNSILNCSVLT